MAAVLLRAEATTTRTARPGHTTSAPAWTAAPRRPHRVARCAAASLAPPAGARSDRLRSDDAPRGWCTDAPLSAPSDSPIALPIVSRMLPTPRRTPARRRRATPTRAAGTPSPRSLARASSRRTPRRAERLASHRCRRRARVMRIRDQCGSIDFAIAIYNMSAVCRPYILLECMYQQRYRPAYDRPVLRR